VEGRKEATMNVKVRWIAGGVATLAVVAGGAGLAAATAGDDDVPLSGGALDHATAAALEHTGGGTVLEAEGGDDGAAYGVEIRLSDGSVVEVALDERFRVIGDATDEESAGVKERDDAGED
jgi:hypothetical protein